MRLHEGEVAIGIALARRLLAEQFPAWAELPLVKVADQGSDNVMFRLGSDLALRIPRTVRAVPALLTELQWLPLLGPSLPLPVPMPLAEGAPGLGYPFPWSVCRWVPGAPPDLAPLGEDAARSLGVFVLALQSLDTTGGPVADASTNRAGSLAAYDELTRTCLDEVTALMAAGRLEPDLLDPARVLEVWDAAVAAPAWSGPGVWLHRDLYRDNVLAQGETLTGVVDFGGLVVGDPAGDAIAGWHLFDPPHRDHFRATVGIDDATWERARGWTLSQGLLALPYYLDTHPGMVRMARRAISATTGSTGAG